MLNFDPNEAKAADNFSQVINETGKYKGTITRAEKLLSQKGTKGIGLSFKADDGSVSEFLDLYTENASGDTLPSMKVVQAIMGCLLLRKAEEGNITVEKYNKETKTREKETVAGYPDLMGKRIGLLLQKELAINNKTGAEVSRMIIAGVFQADTELTVSEILERKTVPEKLGKMVAALKPVRDSRKGATANHSSPVKNDDPFGGFEDDVPFN